MGQFAQLRIVLVLAGLVLILMAIVGSGDYIKIVIPTLKPWARIALAVVGVAVFSLAFIPGVISNPPSSVKAAPTLSTPSRAKNASPTDLPTPTPVQLSVTITSPSNGARLPNNTFGASGTAQDIPAGDSLWLVLKPPTYYKWYPVSRITVVNGIWEVGADKICPAGGRQSIRVFLVPNFAAGQLAAYVSHRSSQHDPGIRNMPALATPVAISRINVGHVQQCGT
jgi:hypothetical protein